MHLATRRRTAAAAILMLVAASTARGEVAADQQQVAVGYQRLETLALRIADAVEASDPARAEQMRAAIAEARSAGLGGRFDAVVRLLERERYAAARRDQTELATQLEELLRLVMADPGEARREEERQRLEALQRDIRAALREQRALRARAARGEGPSIAERQERLAEKVERLVEPAAEADRLAGAPQHGRGQPGQDQPNGEAPPGEGKPGDEPPGDKPPGQQGAAPGEGEPSEKAPSISGRLESSSQSMRQAGEKFANDDDTAQQDQRQAQRDLEAAGREAEERLRQLREEEQQRRLASLAERFRRMHEAETGVLNETLQRVANPAGDAGRAAQLAAAKIADRQAAVASSAEQALRVVRADGKSLIFDQALTQTLGDMQVTEKRLRQARFDATTQALTQTIVDALAELIKAVDQSLDELEQKRDAGNQGPPQGGQPGDRGLASQLAELRLIRAMQARLLRQTELWFAAGQAKSASEEVVREQLAELARQQDALAEAAAAVAQRGP
ncbi:collagen-like protein [Botrimarina sp.]|uniref:collagen-like protein n=1 Tax=Botrimarina sp. TaxID=2795802 RepID=UPI0032EDE28E